ncbi:ABC transporter ATP-binding protein [Sphaerimonospora cavernae]|uniref:ABC transporter ATP-binding protein n=1 Tax=Sphaerimonospora cavernae TaxID=1740611 RepID=A0ABV6TXB7_9ACTN
MLQGLRVIWVAVRAEPGVFTGAVLASALYGAMTVASSWALGWATDHAVLPAFGGDGGDGGDGGGAATGALLLAALFIVGVAVFKAAGVMGRRILAGIMQYRMQARSRREVTRQYLRLPLAWHHRHPTGQLLSNANSDVEAAWGPLAPLPMAVGVIVMLVTAAVAIVFVDPVLALVGFLIFPAVALLNLVYQRRLSPLAMRAQQLRAEVSEVAHESFDGALVVKTLGREDAETTRFQARADELRDANIAVGRVRGLFDPLLEALPTLGVLAVLLVGAARLEAGSVATGDLVQVAYLFTLLAWPIRALGWVLAELPRSVVGWSRVREVLDATGSMTYGTAALDGAGPARVTAENVRYGYDPASPVLKGVSFRIEPGRTTAVVGQTGSGKSTLTQLLARLIDPDHGAMRIDGTDLREVAKGGVSGAVALVPQQTFLFDDTVRGNITLGLDVPDEKIWAALRLAQAEGFVSALPSGLDTRVGERGATLSGGQRQRLALARALVREPRLLILDDATSSVDPQVEKRILHGLREESAESTVVVVAYRMATIALADEVAYLEHGTVADHGPHDELLARCEGYRALVTAYQREEAERSALDEAVAEAVDEAVAEAVDEAVDTDEEVVA